MKQLIIILFILKYFPIMAQPELINDIKINDSLEIKHYSYVNKKDYREWRTILYNTKNNKRLEVGRYEQDKPPFYIKTNKYLQIFAATLFDKTLYTLECNHGIISINCKEFTSPTTFNSIIYPFESYKLATFSTSPICFGNFLQIDNDIYFFLYVSEVIKLGSPLITGIYILKPDKVEKIEIKYQSNDIEFVDKSHFIDSINLEKDNQQISDTVQRIVQQHYPEVYTFEYLGYFTNTSEKVKQYYEFYHFFFKVNGKINFITYKKNEDYYGWLFSKAFITKQLEETGEISKLFD